MKLQYKLLLMLILFFGIVVFYNQKSFAFTNDDCKKFYDSFSKPIESTSDILSSGLPYIDQISTSDISYNNTEITEGNFLYCTYTKDNYTHYSLLYMKYQGLYYLDSITFSPQSFIYYLCKIDNKYATLNNFVLGLVDIKIDNSGNISKILYYPGNFSGFSVSSENFKILYTTSDFTILNENGKLSFFQSSGFVEPDVDKLNLYELNLTDLDYNNQVHQFNLATYTNSPCYDEIMEYYNKNYQYAIYVTDYRRTLTYGEPDNDDSFQYGSYNLSGYIDYIAHDKGVFFYDNFSKQIRTGIYQTEVTIKPTTEYTKRFYFNAVYSEDSNDPNMIIFEDNGNLGQTYNLNNIYAHFIGSSQTMYYCHENNTSNISTNGIVTRISTVYYKGYLNPWGNIDKDKVRDISNIPFYVYNFKFAGGKTNLLFLNSPTYTNDISNIYNDLNEIHTNNEIVPDSSEGGSYIQGIDSTSSTYEPDKVTNDTTNEQDKEHEGGIRVPGVTTEDRTNWTILDYVKNIFKTILDLPKTIIQGISNLFNSGDDGSSAASSITETTDTITDKFSFKDNMINNANEIKDFISSTQATRKYYLNINHKYLSGNICIIDLSWYEPYKPTVDAFICAFAYLAFMWHMFCNIPNLIRGASAGSYVSEIQSYHTTGTGRSSSIHKGGK